MNARGDLAIPKQDLLQINTSSQQCEVFGLHPKLPVLRDLYNDKDLLFVAGVGVLSEPVTKDDFIAKTRTILFAHDKSKSKNTITRPEEPFHQLILILSNHYVHNTIVQAEISRLDPYGMAIGTGILGRLSDVLTSKSYNVNSFSIDASLVALQGDEIGSKKASVTSLEGFNEFNPSDKEGKTTPIIPILNGKTDKNGGIFSEFWSSSIVSKELYILSHVRVSNHPSPNPRTFLA